MPSSPPRVCARCRQPAEKGKPCACRKPWEGGHRRSARGRRWTELRAAKLRANPFCAWPGCRRVASTVDHITPLAEDPTRQYDWANLQSLCRQHDIEKTTQDGLRGKKRARGDRA
jgi:5-methylcytosine-specific restriction enzyme A